jgi:hypothetical protein
MHFTLVLKQYTPHEARGKRERSGNGLSNFTQPFPLLAQALQHSVHGSGGGGDAQPASAEQHAAPHKRAASLLPGGRQVGMPPDEGSSVVAACSTCILQPHHPPHSNVLGHRHHLFLPDPPAASDTAPSLGRLRPFASL